MKKYLFVFGIMTGTVACESGDHGNTTQDSVQNVDSTLREHSTSMPATPGSGYPADSSGGHSADHPARPDSMRQ